MPEEDFEIFLSLLGQLLRLDPQQKSAIADELRDHLEERLLELNEQGIPRKEAVRKALEEFGDAAGLATQFTSLSHQRRRRILMRATLATTAVAGLVFLAIVLFGPSNPDGPPQQVVAQAPEPAQQNPSALPPEPTFAMPEKLLQEVVVEFVDTPLRDAADFLSDSAKLKVMIEDKALTEEGVAIDEPINMSAKSPLYLVLNRMLKPLGLSWYYKNDLLFITTMIAEEDTLSTKYYPVKPILDRGFSKEQVIDLLTNVTKGSWIDIDGTGGQSLFIGQMLSVRQTYHNQIEIAALLTALQAALSNSDQPVHRLEPKEHAKLRQALELPVDVDFVDTPLEDAADFLSDAKDVPIVLDEKALTEEGVAMDEPVNLTLAGKSLQTTLELMLDPFDLEAVLEDGTILITTKTKAEENLTPVIYNVKHIADSESGAGSTPGSDADRYGGTVAGNSRNPRGKHPDIQAQHNGRQANRKGPSGN